MSDFKWIFPGGAAREKGLNSGDMETFKSNPIAGLAREICQNSIDACLSDEKPVHVEFKLFEVKREVIPGIDELEKEILKCKEYNQKNKKSEEILTGMLDAVKSETIKCLRISDFNTSGLLGVSKDEHDSAFYSLTQGNGVSHKVGTTGGSKGIGKYAAFVCSRFNTVFYSTVTKENEKGYIGVTELCSSPVDGDQNNMTQGVGFYCADLQKSAILESFSLDGEFQRDDSNSGTDVYVLGFKDDPNWEMDILSNILESFISAIFREKLSIAINDILVNKDNLKEIVATIPEKKKIRKTILSQYLLLTEPTFESVVATDFGDAKLYIKQFKKENSELATNNITMIRYPYMKICDMTSSSSIVPFSAMCIIENNQLNKVLRDIENPQHNGWEPKRIDDLVQRKVIQQLISGLKSDIMDIISEKLRTSDSESADVHGAEELLPENGADENGDSSNKTIVDTPTKTPAKRVKHKANIGDEAQGGESTTPDIGKTEEGEGEGEHPVGENTGGGGSEHPGSEESNIVDGESIVMKASPLTGLRYTFIALDVKNGKYAIVFNSIYNENNLDLSLYSVDDTNKKEKVEIISAKINGNEGKVSNGILKNLSIKIGEKVKVLVETNQHETFAAEVKICK